MKRNKYSMGGLITKILREVKVDFGFEEKKYEANIARLNFFGLKIKKEWNRAKPL